ncbi:MAG: signal peptidase II, partial [Croceimicrobium sp.]
MRRALWIILGVLILDQALKIWVKTSFTLGEDLVITDWFILHFTENPGMAFGVEFGGTWGKLLLSVFRI